jgi:protein tyrosine/serine phosphatase
LSLSGNVHAVVPDEVYRSSQLDSEDLATLVARYHIRSILNLWGVSEGSEWYQAEKRTADRLNVRRYDYGISANRDVPDGDIAAIVALLKEAPKPLLIHCKSGSDRAGLAAALYLYAVRRLDAGQASRQLSVRYGHFPLVFNSTAAMDRTFVRYVARHPR